MLEVYYFYNTIKTTRKSDDTDIGKNTSYVAFLQSIVNDSEALDAHVKFLGNEVAEENKFFYNDFKKVLVVLRDQFKFTQRLEKKIPENLSGRSTEYYASILISVFNERKNEVLAKKNPGFWGSVVGQTETQVASLQPSKNNSPNISDDQISVASTTTMANIHEVNLTGIKFIEPKPEWTFKKFNEKFEFLLKINKIKLKEDLTDDKSEDPCILDAYQYSVLTNDEWNSAVKQARASEEGKKAHLKKIMELAESILEPTHQSLLHLIHALTELRDKYGGREDAESARSLYRSVQRMAEMPCLADLNSTTFLNFILLNSSYHKKNIANLVDIKNDTLESIQNKIDKQIAISPTSNDEETGVNAVQFKRNFHREGHKRFDDERQNNSKYCHVHGENQTHTTKECRTILKLKQRNEKPEKSVKNVRAQQENEYSESDSDSSEYGQFLGIKAVRSSCHKKKLNKRVYEKIACGNGKGEFTDIIGLIDTGADISVAPYSLAKKLGITHLQEITKPIFAFDNSEASSQFAGKQKIRIKIQEKELNVEVLFLKKSIKCSKMLIGMDVLGLHPFKIFLSKKNNWKFEWISNDKQQDRYIKMSDICQDNEKPWTFEPGEEKIANAEFIGTYDQNNKYADKTVCTTPFIVGDLYQVCNCRSQTFET